MTNKKAKNKLKKIQALIKKQQKLIFKEERKLDILRDKEIDAQCEVEDSYE